MPHGRGPSEDRAIWARYQTALNVLREVLSALDAAAIPALPVKGILTAHLLYDDVAARPMRDIDLRVRRSDFRRLLAVARRQGWAPRVDSPHLWEAVLHCGDWSVDVECSFSDPGLCAIPIERVMSRATSSVEPFGFPHLELELHDHALLLVLNTFKDGLHPALWAVEDLLRIARQPGFDAQRLLARAREGRVLTALWLVADWLVSTRGSDEWAGVRAGLGAPPSPRVLRWFRHGMHRGWQPKTGMLITAASSDSALQACAGLALAVVGVASGRLNRLLDALNG